MTPAKTHAWVRIVVDYLGLAAFLAGYLITKDLIVATWALVAGSLVGLAVGFVFERRLAPMPLIAGVLGIVFGTLTLVFHDTTFIKVKPTVVNGLFALALTLGMLLRKNPLKAVLGETIRLPDPVWQTLTWRYVAFFVFCAVLNLIVWKTQSEATWVIFRMPGLPALAVVFSLMQAPLMMRHMKPNEPLPPPPNE